MTEKRRGRAARHIVEVLPKDYVLELFGFTNPGSLRKLMSRRGKHAVVGYTYDDVREVFESWSPERAWDRSPLNPDEKKDD